jgi:hypothetical protein
MSSVAAYKAALSLNNTGCSLLQRSCYSQGFDTLRDAVFLMKASLQQDAETLSELVTHKLNEASRRTIACPGLHLHASSTSTSPSIKIVSHDAADFASAKHNCDVDVSSTKIRHTLIRFESSDLDLLLAEADQDLPCAIILFNLAIASLLCHKDAAAASFLSCSLHLLRDMFHRAQEQYFYLNRVIFISTLCLATMLPMQLNSGKIEDADESSRSIAYLEELAQSLEHSGLFQESAGGLLAAAA